MAYINENLNPFHRRVGDCVIRAIAKVLNMSWDDVAIDLSMMMVTKKDIITSNSLWGEYLALNGFRRGVLPNTCPDCFTLKDFCREFPVGEYVVCTGNHVVTIINGNVYDAWDSSKEIPVIVWKRR